MSEINDYRKELKSRIIDYAMDEFFKPGIKAVKMDEISQGLHVSKRTVYEIFSDKEELLLAGLKARDEQMRKQLFCQVFHLYFLFTNYNFNLGRNFTWYKISSRPISAS